MIAAVEYAAFGVTGDHNVLDLELGQRFVAITDRDEAVDFLVAEQTAVHQRSAPVTQALIGAAAVDPELDRYLGELIAGVGRQVRRVLDVSRERGWLRDDVPFDELVETTAVISSIETYMRMVHRDGWSLERLPGLVSPHARRSRAPTRTRRPPPEPRLLVDGPQVHEAPERHLRRAKTTTAVSAKAGHGGEGGI